MSDDTETYVKKMPDGSTAERVVSSPADRVAATFAGFAPKNSSKGGGSTSAAAKPAATTDKAADAK